MSDDSANKVRIIGGINATAPIPWQVHLIFHVFHDWNGTVISTFTGCGGTILDRRTILTAAHCIEPNNTLIPFALGVGIVDRNDNMLITPKSVTIHEKYDDVLIHNDIAIIKLEVPLNFSENVGPACLPKKSYDPKAGTECFISGWGSEEQEIPGENDSG